MKFLRTSSVSATLLLPTIVVVSIAIAMAIAMPLASAFTSPSSIATAGFQSLSLPSSSSRRQRERGTSSLASRQRDDLEDQLWAIQNSWKYTSDVSSDDTNSKSNASNLAKEFKDRFLKLPPQPEDQFIMTGDIAILFLYAFTSHSVNDSVVKGLLDNPHMTIPEAVKELDPLHEIVNLQHPVWVDLASNPNVPFGNPAVDRALEVSARESLMNHWGPLLSTEGSACVALCTCWLIAGWFHRAFLFDNSTYCNSNQALTKTVETWMTSALLLACFATGADWLVGHVPALESLFCVTCKSATASANGGGMDEFKAAMTTTTTAIQLPVVSILSLTQSDVMFIVDSLTVLIAWRWSAHRLLNTFR